MNYTAIAEIIAGIYMIIIAINMLQFKGRQKDQILAAIPDQDKAMEYGKQGGKAYLLTGIVITILGILYFITNIAAFNGIIGIFILIMLFVIMNLNNKIAGKANVTIF
jgi:predicted ABC-type exoprotein transport system permease subunit